MYCFFTIYLLYKNIHSSQRRFKNIKQTTTLFLHFFATQNTKFSVLQIPPMCLYSYFVTNYTLACYFNII